ncbi:MAG: hypothetical protein Q9198_005497 [Flavoplaca austrocitrina]
MIVQHVHVSLRQLNDAHKQTVQLIHRLGRHSVPLGSNALNSNVRLELSTEIHQNLKDQEEELELLRQEIDDQTVHTAWTTSLRKRNGAKQRDYTDVVAELARLAEDLKHARSQFRKAQLQAKRSVESAKRKDRELLFAGIQEGSSAPGKARFQGREQLSKDQLELNASSDVTAALRRVHLLMQSEVSRSQFALETLHQSTAALSTLSVSYTKLDTLLSSSRSLVSTLLHSQKSDTWYLESAFWILIITISWLIFRRILYGPGWWLLYLPAKLVWQLAVFITQSFLGAFTYTIGVLGATKQSTALGQASGQVSATLPEQPSATGEIPTFPAGMSAPFVRVGGGGKGQPPPQKPQVDNQTRSDAVGEMAQKDSGSIASGSSLAAEGSEGTILREREPDETQNPKKRMWEEHGDAPQTASRPRDEL